MYSHHSHPLTTLLRTLAVLSSAARMFLFQLLLVLLASIVTKSLFATVQTLAKNPTELPQFLARAVPAQSIFFLTYVCPNICCMAALSAAA